MSRYLYLYIKIVLGTKYYFPNIREKNPPLAARAASSSALVHLQR